MLAGLVTKEPVSQAKPHLWNFAEVRPHVLQAGSLITAEEAERRVLVLENPGLRGESRITQSLYAGLQLILPGEIAPAHRHTASALRFIIEGSGAYTAVDGEKTIMEEGDFVITPPWAWHDHGNDSDRPMIWLDGLDVPMVNSFDTSFAENLAEDEQQLSRPAEYSPDHYSHNLLPVGYENTKNYSPIFNYPYARTRETLHRMAAYEEWDPCHGLKLQYTNPVDGGYAMPTIATFMQLLPKGTTTTPYRSTDGTVYSAVEGTGRTVVRTPGRRPHAGVGPEGRLHRAELDEPPSRMRRRGRAVQLLRPRRPAQTRHLARAARQRPGFGSALSGCRRPKPACHREFRCVTVLRG